MPINPPTAIIPSILVGSGTLTGAGSQPKPSSLGISPGGQFTATAGREEEATTAIVAATVNKVFLA
ncbi:hypothetical protein CYANOKiyG1_79420 [Okeania sp. KiyG1]|nr:hypothetical protein CYANOKiyG1_79420 [Okeania sp. KiyG1]